ISRMLKPIDFMSLGTPGILETQSGTSILNLLTPRIILLMSSMILLTFDFTTPTTPCHFVSAVVLIAFHVVERAVSTDDHLMPVISSHFFSTVVFISLHFAEASD